MPLGGAPDIFPRMNGWDLGRGEGSSIFLLNKKMLFNYLKVEGLN